MGTKLAMRKKYTVGIVVLIVIAIPVFFIAGFLRQFGYALLPVYALVDLMHAPGFCVLEPRSGFDFHPRESCYIHFAVQYLDVDVCKNVAISGSRARECYGFVADAKNDINVCNQFATWYRTQQVPAEHREEQIEACYSKFYKYGMHRNPSSCDGIADRDLRTNCYAFFGKTSVSGCDGIESFSTRSQCYFFLARSVKNPSICGRIIMPKHEYESASACYRTLATLLKDSSLCSNVADQDWCYYTLATQELQDKALCSKIVKPILQQQCLEDPAFKNHQL